METRSRRALALMLALAMAIAWPTSPAGGAEETLEDLVEYVLLSPQPASEDIMNDEIPKMTVLGDRMVFLWETDYTHWPNPDGSQPDEDPVNEDVQIRFMEGGKLSPVFNVSTEGTIQEGYGHRPNMAVYDGRLYVYWNSHAWSGSDTFQVVLRVYDPANDTWDQPRTISEAPEGGIAAGAAAAEFNGRLHFAWQMRVPFEGEDEGENPGIEIYHRWFDGQAWGPVQLISEGIPGQDTEPSVMATSNRLHVAWGHDDPSIPGHSDIHYRTMDMDGRWGELVEGLGNGPERSDKKVRLVDWDGRACLLWQSDGINLQGRVYSDAMLMVEKVGGGWGPPLMVSPSRKDAGNVVPDAVPYDGRLYIAWATSDDGITTGQDLDVVMRDFDGTRFGDIVTLSPVDSYVKDNPSDEGSVSMAVYQGNIYAVFDAIFSPVTDGDNKDVVLRYVGYDLDGDGVRDSLDAFPRNGSETADTDRDGVGDNADAFPDDPTRWERTDDGDDEGVPAGRWLLYGSLLAIVLVLVLLPARATRRRPGPKASNKGQ